ncbi:hypothetical protein ACFPOB_15205 [Bosea eneae]|uniref:Uncharacterized protein n=1 Tax=Bosea eneae TaxID=151454 RepID=A0ABW0IUE9_9HYPH
MSTGKRPGKPPSDRLAEARQAASAAQADVAAASRHRLAELMRQPAHARLEALNDAALEPAEREQLRRSLASLLARSGKSARTPKTPLVAKDFAFLLNWKMAVLVVMVAGTSVAAARSGGQRAIMTRATEVRGILSNGSVGWLPLARGQAVVVTSRDQREATIRVWQAREGYARAQVPLELMAAPPR